jgi:uncharacterized repeat protein (TIGR01451 family)
MLIPTVRARFNRIRLMSALAIVAGMATAGTPHPSLAAFAASGNGLKQVAATNGKIAFSSNRIGGILKVFTMNADGSGVTCLMCDGASDPSGTGSTSTDEGRVPAFSPNGNTIAFVRGSVIWLMNADGTNQRSLSVTGTSPAWSPDSTRIVYAASGDIYIVNAADGSGQAKLTNTPGFSNNVPSWSAASASFPQGRIAFSSSRDGNFEIYVIAPATPNELFQNTPQVNVTNNAAFDHAARWSPDGLKLVFHSDRNKANESDEDIYVLPMNPIPGTVVRLTTGPTTESFASWSPDGTRIAYNNFVGSAEVFVIDAATGAPAPGNITNNAAVDFDVNWGPAPTATNGKVVFQKGSNGASDLYTITPGTGVSIGLRKGYHPVYSPNGMQIAFVDNTAGATNGQIMLMNADGTNVRQLVHPTVGFSPTWSPDGLRMAFIRGDFVSTGDTGSGNLYVMDMTPGNEGANEVAIAGAARASKPSWGAGNRIVYQCRSQTGTFFQNPLGICATDAVPATSEIAANPPSITLLPTGHFNDRDPAWSHDGTQIAFLSTRDYAQAQASEIYASDAQGGNARRVTNASTFFKSGPAWSPDGMKIVFYGGTNGNNLRMVNADGSNGTAPTFVTSFGSGDAFPHWGVAPPAGPIANLSLESMTDSPDPLEEGAVLNYTLTIKNLGPATATGLKAVSDPIPANVAVHDLQPGCPMSGNRVVTCTIDGTLASGASMQKVLGFREIGNQPGNATVKFTVSSNETDPDPSNNSRSASTQIIPLALTLNFDGKIRDRVGRTETASPPAGQADGNLDAVFTLSFPASSTAGFGEITRLNLTGPNGNEWDTQPGNGKWVLGFASQPDYVPSTGAGALLNNADGSINFRLGNPPGTWRLFAADTPAGTFKEGDTFTLAISFSSGTVALGSTQISRTQTDVGVSFQTLPPTSVKTGDTVTFPLRVINSGPEYAKGVTFDGFIDSKFTSVKTGSAGCAVLTGNKVHCDFGTIEPDGGVKAINITAKAFTPGSSLNRMFESVDVAQTIDNNSLNSGVEATIEIVGHSLDLLGIEVTQGVQDMKNGVPLVEDKKTIVRAHVRNLGTGTASVQGEIVGTRIEPGGPRTALGKLKAANTGRKINAQADPSRANLAHSLFFEVPLEWRKGTVELEFRGLNSTVTCSDRDGTPDCKSTVTFNPVRSLDMKFILMTYNDAKGVSHASSLLDAFAAANEFLGRYPINTVAGEDSVGAATTTQNPCLDDGKSNPNSIGIRTELNSLRNLECKDGTCARYFQGLLADQSGPDCKPASLNGIADLPGNASVAFYPTSDPTPRIHEQGHVMGLKHTRFNGETCVTDGKVVPCTTLEGDGTLSLSKKPYDADTVYGYDINNSAVSTIFPAETADFMSYGRPRWPSRANYVALFNILKLTASGDDDAPAGKLKGAAVQATQTVLIDGTVKMDGSAGQIGSVFASGPGNINLPAAGRFTLRFENAQGAELASYSFEPIAGSEEQETGVISLNLPWNADARRIVLLFNGTMLASRQASPSVPVVAVTFPNGGETLSGPTATFTWTATDADGDALKFALEYSADNGATWKALAINMTATSLPIDLTKLPGSNQALFRVSATDGFNSSQDQSNAVFTVPPHAPAAMITLPANNRLYVEDQTVLLEGMGLDIEDGFLSSSKLAWSSSLNGPLGTGSSVGIDAMTLNEGTHVITLTATDNGGATGSATTTIQVMREAPTLPPTLGVGPQGLLFLTAGGTASPPVAQLVSIDNSGDGALSWSAAADQPWIQLNAASGPTPANLSVSVDAAGLAAGEHIGKVTITAAGAASSPQVVDVHLFIVPNAVRADIDGNSSYDALTDGLLALRYTFGLTGSALTNGAVGSGSTRTSPAEIVQYLDGIKSQLDVDGNGQSDALTDGLLMLRYLFGLRGQALINSAIGAGATRTTAAAIEAYLKSIMP